MDLAPFKKFVFLQRGWVSATWEKTEMRIRAAQRRGLVFDPWNPENGENYLLKRLEDGATTFAYNSDVKLLNLWHLHKTGEESKFKPRKKPRSTFKFLSPPEIARVFTYRHRYREVTRLRVALFFWALKSGMRVGEIAAMTTDHLNPQEGKFLVAKPSKRGNRRWLPIERFVWSPKRPFTAYLRQRAIIPGDEKAVWTTRFSGRTSTRRGPPRRMTEKALTDSLRDMGRSVGLNTLNFNITRHTRGTELYRKWRDLLLVKKYLGHSSLSSTEVYAAVVDGDLDGEMRRRPGSDPFQPGEDFDP